jgi:ribosomal protein L16 Arg81 hydroxylase
MDLHDILKPISTSTFLRDYLGKQFLYINGEPEKLGDILPWEALNTLINFHQFAGLRLRLMKEAQLVPPESYLSAHSNNRSASHAVNSSALERHLRDGATLVLDAIDWLYEPISVIARNIERLLRVDVQVNTYAGWRESPGLGLHWDRHDVLILQISGRKTWHVYEPTRLFPIQADTEPNEKPQADPISVTTLSAGDVLYIPRGWWHIAVPCGEPTLHLTVGLHSRTGADFAAWLINDVKKREIMRKDIPVLADTATLDSYLADVRTAIIETCNDPEVLSKFLRHMTAVAKPRPKLGLPFAATPRVLPDSDAYLICSMIPREGAMAEGTDGLIEVSFAGKAHKFVPECRRLLEYVDNGTPVEIRSFYDTFEKEFGEEKLTQVLLDLATTGIIAFQEPQPLHAVSHGHGQ